MLKGKITAIDLAALGIIAIGTVGVLNTVFNNGSDEKRNTIATPEEKAVTVEGTKITVDCAVGTRSKLVKQLCADHGLRMN